MELRNLYSFLRIAELGSFTKAADSLGYAQSTITTQIQQLETEMGEPLFERIGKKVLLTEKGQKLVTYANQMFFLEQKIKNMDAEESELTGHIRIGIVESIMSSLLLAIIKKYRETYPKITISIKTAVSKDLFELLRQNEVDIVFTMGRLTNVKDCVRIASHPERAVFITSKSNPFANREALTLKEVLAEPIIEIGQDTFLQQELYERTAAEEIPVTSFIQTESSKIILDLVDLGLGNAFLPEYLMCTESVGKRQIQILPVVDFSCPFYMHIFYHKNKWRSPQMDGLIQLVEEYWATQDALKADERNI